jgi:hypothetical protein
MCGDPKMSQRARRVAFKSAAINLVRLLPLDSLLHHLYLLDRETEELIQIDDPDRGFDPNQFIIGQYDMDGEGNIIVFEALKRKVNDPVGTLSTTDLFLFDASTTTVRQLSTGIFSEKACHPTLSGDGRFVGFVFRGIDKKESGGLIIYDRQHDTWRKVMSGSCFNPQMSKDGRILVFESDEELVPGAGKDVKNIYAVKNPFLEY